MQRLVMEDAANFSFVSIIFPLEPHQSVPSFLPLYVLHLLLSATFAVVMLQWCWVGRPLTAAWLHSVGISSQPSHPPFLCHRLSQTLNALSVWPPWAVGTGWANGGCLPVCLTLSEDTRTLWEKGEGDGEGLVGTAAMPGEPSPSQSSIVPCRPIPNPRTRKSTNTRLLQAQVGSVIGEWAEWFRIGWCIKKSWNGCILLSSSTAVWLGPIGM